MSRITGRVKWFNPQRGYGFIVRDKGNDVYVNARELMNADDLRPGQVVEFEIEETSRGPRAVHVFAQEVIGRYDFVPIHETVDRRPVAGHQRIDPTRRTGLMEFALRTLSPLFVGTGLYGLSDDLGLGSGRVVRSCYRINGVPAVPASSLKGVVRSVAEAVSASCVTTTMMQRNKLPEDLTGPCTVEAACPACTLFGTQGYIGQVHFEDCRLVEDTSTGTHRIPALYAPRAAEGARPYFDKGGNYLGRKFYRHGRPEKAADMGEIEVIPPGRLLLGRLEFFNLTEEQLGLLFYALGLGGGFRLKLGGGKPVCLGSVQVLPGKLTLWKPEGAFLSAGRKAAEAYTEGELTAFVERHIRQAMERGYILAEQAEKLEEILAYAPEILEPCPTGAY